MGELGSGQIDQFVNKVKDFFSLDERRKILSERIATEAILLVANTKYQKVEAIYSANNPNNRINLKSLPEGTVLRVTTMLEANGEKHYDWIAIGVNDKKGLDAFVVFDAELEPLVDILNGASETQEDLSLKDYADSPILRVTENWFPYKIRPVLLEFSISDANKAFNFHGDSPHPADEIAFITGGLRNKSSVPSTATNSGLVLSSSPA